MKLLEQLNISTTQWRLASAYERFEQLVVLILTGLIIIVIASAVWHLAFKVLFSLILSSFDPTDPTVFQSVFGMVLTVIIAMEFKHSILIMVGRQHGIVQVRTVVLIAMLVIIRKFILIDISTVTAGHVLALAAAIIALGAVYWLVREQDRKDQIDDKERGARENLDNA